jgi:hypothetical protein
MNKNIPRVLVMTAFATAISLASSTNVFATQVPQDKAALATAHAAQPIHKKKHRAHKKSVEETAEDRIKYLHTVLQITPAQEDQWAKVAAVMRENADDITALAKARSENSKDMTAVDDLKSYAEFSSAHEDGTKKLIPVFKTLYEDMSPAQQKVADTVFHDSRHGGGGHPKA